MLICRVSRWYKQYIIKVWKSYIITDFVAINLSYS